MQKTGALLSALFLVLFLGAGVSLAAAGETESRDKDKHDPQTSTEAHNNPFIQASKGAPSKKKESDVIRTEDLERKYGPPSSSVPDSAPQEGQDPLAAMEQRKAAAADQNAKVGQAEQDVEAKKRRVADLEKRILALKNPLLQRPAPPEDAEAKKEWESMGTGDRVERSNQELQKAREELQQAEQELSRLRSSGS